jgi:hypothetical protein
MNEVITMTLVEKFVKEFEELPKERQIEVIDFIEFLRAKEEKKLNDMMDGIIEDNKEALFELAK